MNQGEPQATPGSASGSAPDFTAELLARLSNRTSAFARYSIHGEVARGGMGAVLRVRDEDLRRELAMKVMLVATDPRIRGDAASIEAPKLARFLEEAQVTGQLDHPGIVPVHELGLDPQGRVYFTMKLVKGRTLAEVLAFVPEEREGWSQARALGVIQKVCEAMAYAHDKGVIHRDLKPANVMVGSFGEVYVMDWGLARIQSGEERGGSSSTERAYVASSELHSNRDEHRSGTPDSPLLTMEGEVFGTPGYMSPEQASGRADEVGTHSDVYAVGAMIYHLLAGRMPHQPEGEELDGYALWTRVREGPPTPLHTRAPRAPAELVAICEKAMARDWRARYRDMKEMAADLSAFLEGRVVAAYQTGAWAETKKWVARNKPLAASLAAGILALVAGLFVSLSLKQRADANAELAETRRIEAQENESVAKASETRAVAGEAKAQRQEEIAKTQEALAKQEKANVLRLSAFQTLDDLTQEADTLWPMEPALVERYARWLERAQQLIDSISEHRAALAEIETEALPETSAKSYGQPREWHFASDENRWWHAQMEKLIAALSEFGDEEGGLVRGISVEHGLGIAKRFEFAKSIAEASVTGTVAQARWAEAIRAISKSEKYAGVIWPSSEELGPQLGLVPIGADPESGLVEFAHLATGKPAKRGVDRKLVLTEKTGVVFVLIPGGTFWMGAQNGDPAARNYDLNAEQKELPVHEVTLAPYFVAKHEMTQAQWMRVTGRNPSRRGPALLYNGKPVTLLHPVENVSWNACAEVLSRLGLELPTEAQWENAARAGTSTPWWSGADKQSLEGVANLADRYCSTHGGPPDWDYETWLDDGWSEHAPVGSFRANAFGLHDVHGNVWEWCREAHRQYELPVAQDDAERQVLAPVDRVFRGGSWDTSADLARVSSRTWIGPEFASAVLGLRPARIVAGAIDPSELRDGKR